MIEWFIWGVAIIISGVGSGYHIKRYKRPDLLIGLYVLFLAAAQIIAAKIITVGPFIVPASVFIYPFTLLLLDCIVEFFGKQEAYRAIGICFTSQVVLALLIWLSLVSRPAEFWALQAEWEQIFNQGLRIIAASWTAFLATQLIDTYLFSKLREWVVRRWREARYPAARAGLVDIPVLAIDSVIFITAAFYGVFDILPLIVGQIVTKWIIGVADSPIISLAKKIAYG